jgi:serine phosphatase RsbU (regulator of sigma subunit)
MNLKNHITILIIIIFNCCTICFGQNQSNTSLLISQKIKSYEVLDDTIKIKNFIDSTNAILSSQPFQAKDQANLSLKASLKLNYKLGIAKSHKMLGVIHYKQGDFPTALQHYFDCLSYYESIKDLKGMASLYNNIGLVYSAKNESQKALNYHLKSLNIKKQLNDETGISATYNNIGIIYSGLNNIDSSKYYHEKALEIRLRTNDLNGQGNSYYNLATNYFDLKDYKKSLDYHFKALAIFKTTKNFFDASFSLNEIALIYLENGKTKICLQYADSALSIAKEHGINEAIMEAYKTYYLTYNKLNDPINELKYYRLFSELKLEVNSESKAAEIGKMETKFEYENKIKLQELEQDKKNVLQNAESKKQKVTIASIAIILLLVLVFSFFLFNRFKLIKKQNILIEHQKQIVDEKAAELTARQKEILDSIHYAKRIQNTLLAHKEFVDQNIPNNFIYFNPKDIVSGDFYWATKRDNYFYFAVCDSTGHGVPGAFMSLLSIGFLSEAINEKNIIEPNKVFDYVRSRLIDSISKDGQKDGFDGILLQINISNKEIKYAAANNAPLLISNGELKELEKDKMPVGHGEKQDNFKLFNVDLTSGGTLYLYTDGYADQFGGPKGKKFKYKQLNELLAKNSEKALYEQSELLSKCFNDWKGNLEQVDDVCVIGIKL